jgi:hypothetical protein
MIRFESKFYIFVFMIIFMSLIAHNYKQFFFLYILFLYFYAFLEEKIIEGLKC